MIGADTWLFPCRVGHRMRLAGHVAVVTGAGRGIGRSIALALASEGAKVALARTAAEIEAVAAEINTEGGVAKGFQRCRRSPVGHQGFRGDQGRPGFGKSSHQQCWLLFRDWPQLGRRRRGLVARRRDQCSWDLQLQSGAAGRNPSSTLDRVDQTRFHR